MKKRNITWTIRDLISQYENIEFPEFQREPTVWDIDKKRKLLDSILREFDIASIYLYKRKDKIFECIDGRQRINAILSFLGLNEGKSDDGALGEYHNNFKFTSSDELLGNNQLTAYDGLTWNEFPKSKQKEILDYEFNVIEVGDINDDNNELNLMFLRLQLGAPLNAGEKLNAMVGDMKENIFGSLGKHKYFNFLNIPRRRFSRELTAAQIAINFYSKSGSEQRFARARFVDLQEFFKQKLKFSQEDKKLSTQLTKRLDNVFDYVKDSNLTLKNRAIGVSVFFFVNSLIESKKDSQVKEFIKFLGEFLKRLKEQVEKGIDIEPRYRDILKFQTYISQAAVEKYAIENRQKFLEEYFEYFRKNKGKIKGDK